MEIRFSAFVRGLGSVKAFGHGDQRKPDDAGARAFRALTTGFDDPKVQKTLAAMEPELAIYFNRTERDSIDISFHQGDPTRNEAQFAAQIPQRNASDEDLSLSIQDLAKDPEQWVQTILDQARDAGARLFQHIRS